MGIIPPQALIVVQAGVMVQVLVGLVGTNF